MATIEEEQVVSPGMTNWPLWGPGNWRIFVPAPSSGPPPFARSASVRLSSRCTPSSSQAILLSLEALRKLPRSSLIDEPSARAFIPPHTATFPLFPTLLSNPSPYSIAFLLPVCGSSLLSSIFLLCIRTFAEQLWFHSLYTASATRASLVPTGSDLSLRIVRIVWPHLSSCHVTLMLSFGRMAIFHPLYL